MRKTFVLAALSVLVFAILTLVYITRQGNELVLTWVGDIAPMLLSLSAMLACWFAYKAIPKEYLRESRGWFYIALAFLFFMVGDVYWGYSEIFLKVELPLGSFSDLSWELAYLMLFIGFGFVLRMMFHSEKKVRWVTFITALAAIIFISIEMKKYLTTGNWIEAIQDSYVLYDIILLGMITSLLLPLIQSHNRLMNVWLLFGLAVFARIIFDFLFAGMTAIGAYATGSFIDLLYAASYVLFVVSADAKLKMLPAHALTVLRGEK